MMTPPMIAAAIVTAPTAASPTSPATLSTTAITRGLRHALDNRFPGTGAIGPWVPLRGLHGYDAGAAAELLAATFGSHGLTFHSADVDRQSGCLADLVELVDRMVATHLHEGYRERRQ